MQDHGRKILHNLSDKILEFTMNKVYIRQDIPVIPKSAWSCIQDLEVSSFKIMQDVSLLFSNDSSCEILLPEIIDLQVHTYTDTSIIFPLGF